MKTLNLKVDGMKCGGCAVRRKPEGITVKCPDQMHVVVSGCDKQMVGQFAANVRAVKKAEPYLGKGIKYEGEVIRRKESKAAGKK